MRSILLIISLFFLPAIGLAQAPLNTKVKISTYDCRADSYYPSYRTDTISFYKLPENTFAFNVISSQHKRFPIEIDEVPVSSYAIKYINNFSQVVTRQVNIADKRVNNISLCPDSLADYPLNTLPHLTKGDSIVISYNSQGCTHTHTLRLVISRDTTKLVARLYEVSFQYTNEKPSWPGKFNTGKLLRSTNLKEEDFASYIRFENELKYVRDMACTTNDIYEVRSGKSTIAKVDGSCTWRGLEYLVDAFFGERSYLKAVGYYK